MPEGLLLDEDEPGSLPDAQAGGAVARAQSDDNTTAKEPYLFYQSSQEVRWKNWLFEDEVQGDGVDCEIQKCRVTTRTTSIVLPNDDWDGDFQDDWSYLVRMWTMRTSNRTRKLHMVRAIILRREVGLYRLDTRPHHGPKRRLGSAPLNRKQTCYCIFSAAATPFESAVIS